jgi:hypothetical protein
LLKFKKTSNHQMKIIQFVYEFLTWRETKKRSDCYHLQLMC